MARCRVECTNDHISISDDKGEIVYWDRAEWKEDPILLPIIANACYLAGVGEDVRAILGKP